MQNPPGTGPDTEPDDLALDDPIRRPGSMDPSDPSEGEPLASTVRGGEGDPTPGTGQG